jgi:hypothetical protein
MAAESSKTSASATNYYRVTEIGLRLLKISWRILAGHSDRRVHDWPHRDTDCDFNVRAEVLECARIEHRSLLHYADRRVARA